VAWWAAVMTSVGGAACSRPSVEAPSRELPAIVFKDVTVVPMTGGAEIPHVNVVVRGDHVERVDATTPPDGATIIDGHGKYLAPGMVDMHVHLPADVPDPALERIALLSLLNGVTTVRSMQGAPNHLAFRAKVLGGTEVSPELYLAGPPLAETFTPEAARARVREQKTAGYDFIKILGGFDLPAYDAVIDEARKVGMPVVGHVPAEIGIDAALAAHQVTIEHMMGYADAAKTSDAALDALAKKTHDAHVWNCPTIDYFSSGLEDPTKLEARDGLAYVPESDKAEWRKREPSKSTEAGIARMRLEVLALQRAGAGLLVGSDAPEPWIVPGFGFVEEMRELVKAGLTPAEVMTAATRSAADALGRDAHDGTVQVGAVADLILLDRDPMASVDNVTRPAVVMVKGHPWTRAEIEARLAAVVVEPPKTAAP
jgi:imidazolonepropionase-like amidohydrolase